MGALAIRWRVLSIFCLLLTAGGAQEESVAALLDSEREPAELERVLLEGAPRYAPEIWEALLQNGSEGVGVSGLEHRSFLLGVLRKMPATVRWAPLPEIMGEELATRRRVNACWLVGQVGGDGALSALVGVLEAIEAPVRGRPPFATAFERAVRDLLDADPAVLHPLDERLGALPAELRRPALSARASRPDRVLVDDLLASLEAREAWRPMALAVLAGLPRPLLQPAPKALFEALEESLEGRSWREQVLALRVMVAARDPSVIPVIAPLLTSPQKRVRRAALSALQTISGARLGGDPEAWMVWWGREQLWLEERLPALLDALHVESRAEVLQALEEVGRHRCAAFLAAEDLLGLLRGHVDAEVSLAALQVWEAHDLSVGLSAILEVATGTAPRLQPSAWRILRRQTGLRLPCEGAPWEQALERWE
jgi:hypothetical protein